jgi:hypothetical protein
MFVSVYVPARAWVDAAGLLLIFAFHSKSGELAGRSSDAWEPRIAAGANKETLLTGVDRVIAADRAISVNSPGLSDSHDRVGDKPVIDEKRCGN